MIEISHLTKKYGANVAVNDLSLTLEPGNIYGFLGPNGAGKSTTMNIITGYIGASSGEVKINGYDINKNPEEAKKCIGYLPEIPPVYGDMKVLEYLKFVAELKKLDSILRIYYEKNVGKPLAVLENYELTEKRIIEGYRNIYKYLNTGLILFFIFLGILNKSYLDKNFIVLLILEFIVFSIVIRVLFRFSAKSIVKSTYKKFMRGKIIFDKNSMEIIGKEKMASIKVYYNEFYKIKKTKKGYMFFLQKNMFYFLCNYEFKKEELAKLETVLAGYIKK